MHKHICTQENLCFHFQVSLEAQGNKLSLFLIHLKHQCGWSQSTIGVCVFITGLPLTCRSLMLLLSCFSIIAHVVTVYSPSNGTTPVNGSKRVCNSEAGCSAPTKTESREKNHCMLMSVSNVRLQIVTKVKAWHVLFFFFLFFKVIAWGIHNAYQWAWTLILGCWWENSSLCLKSKHVGSAALKHVFAWLCRH